MKNRALYKQLSRSSSPNQAKALAELAEKIGQAAPEGLSKDAKSRIADEIGFRQVIRIPKAAFIGAGSFAVVAMLFLSASALPGSPLYPVKRSGERIREVVQPGYKDELIDIRKGELDQLIQDNAPKQEIEKAQDNYNHAIEDSKKHNKSTKQDTDNKNDDSHDKSRRHNNSKDDTNNRRNNSETRFNQNKSEQYWR